MKLSELIIKLQAIQEEYGDLECVYSVDDEGNEYKQIHYDPSVGEFIEDERCFVYCDEDDMYDFTVNAVCVN